MSRQGTSLPSGRWARRLCLASLGVVAVVVSQVASGTSVGFKAPLTVSAAAQGPTGHPNRFNPSTSTNRPDHLPKPPTANVPKPTFSEPKGQAPVPMKPALVPLDPKTGAHFVGSDGVLELTVPPGAVTTGDVQAAGGSLNLLVRQVEPGSGSSAGGSGHVSFGTWLVQVVDGSGRLAAHGLRQSLGLKLHEDRRAGAVDLAHTRVLVNPPLPSSVNLDPSATLAQMAPASGARAAAPSGGAATTMPASAARQQAPSSGSTSSTAKPALGATSRQTATLDAATTTLSSAVPVATSSAAASFGTDAPVATFGRPDPFETDLAGGSLSAGIQLNLPAGPGGLTPPLTLGYSSAAVSDQHNASAAAPWVGEGWSMGLGAISWAEHQVDLTGCQQCTSVQWEDSWQLSDPYGTAADLVPPDVNVSTYQDDSGNPITASPITWHTAPETRAKVISYGNPSPPFAGPVPPCFRVFLPSGIMEEFGCTADSLQWYTQTSGANAGRYYLANWLLDLITDPQGNQIHVTYQRDVETGNGANLYPRDAVMATVEYDSPGCHDAQVMCAGSNWAPLMRVNFVASHSVAHINGSSCAANGNLRCDDPVDLSGSGGVAAPIVQSVFVLNDAQVQVRPSASLNWNTLRDYQFSYNQQGISTITDPVSGQQESVPGHLLLTALQVIGADGATALPARTFGYQPLVEYYEDVTHSPVPSTNCGPSWNNGQKPNINLGCVLWSQSYQGNSWYLNTVSNGLGLQETFTWQLARNNFYGAPSGSSPADPMVCDNTSLQSSFPCNMPDNQTWSRVVLTQRKDSLLRTAGNQIDSIWNYAYQVQYPLAAQECSGCVASFYWGNQNDFDNLDFYNNKFMGFAQASVQNPDNGVAVHKFLTTQGFGIYDTSRPELVCNTPAPCHSDPYWSLGNAAHGHEYELDQYDTNGTTLLKQAKTQWSAICPPTGVSGTPYNSNWGNWDGDLVTELDHSNPVMVCEIQKQQADTYVYDGTSGLPLHSSVAYTYDNLGRVAGQTTQGGGAAGDSSGHSATATVSGGVSEQVAGLVSGDTDPATAFDGSTAFLSLPASAFGAYPTSGSTTSYGLTFEAWFQTTSPGVILGQTDGTTPSGAPSGYVPALYVDSTGTLRESLFWHGAVGSANVAPGPYNDGRPHQVVVTYSGGGAESLYVDGQLQHSSTAQSETGYSSGYAYLVGTGYSAGSWPGLASGWNFFKGTLDEVSVYGSALTATRVQAHFTAGSGYKAAVLQDLPSAYLRLDDTGASQATLTTSYTVWCSGSAAQTPCVEIDKTQRLNSTTTATSRAFYDGLGHLVETRTPAPGGQHVVRYSFYDASQRLSFQSVPYFVSAYTGAPGSAAFSIPDSTQAGTTYTYDGLGRLQSSTDAVSFKSTKSYGVVCAPAGTGDGSCYEQTLSIDPKGHQGGTLVDALGRTAYEQRYTGVNPLSGSSQSYAVYATAKYTYDYAGDLVKIVQPDAATTTTFGYDMAGRKTSITDPDIGAQSYTYDQNGNLTESVDARGSAGTIFMGYDGLNRPIWRNTTNSPTGAYDTYSYDSTASGNVGIGRLTGETFATGALSGSYAYTYDSRGQQTNSTLTVGGSSYPLGSSYDDAGNVLAQTYPDGETITNSYTAQGWLSGVGTSLGSTPLASNLSYGANGGAFGEITGATLGGGTYTYAATYDLLDRATDLKTTKTSGGAVMFDQQRAFDGTGNVSTITTTMPNATDNQSFCYDEQDRLTWASSATATPPCGGSNTAGTLTAAQYTQTFAYDVLGRLTSGPLGSYSYGSSAHVHAATGIGTAWTSSYDAAGNMTCRAPSSSSTCAGTQTGTQLGYNNEGELQSWQNAPSSPSTTAQFLYDGQGQRVEQSVTQSGTTTTTVYVGDLEEVSTTGGTTTTTAYYYMAGKRVGLSVNGVISYLASDGLGSATVTLSGSGTATGAQLFAPYGGMRYSSGAMPTTYGFTGQRSDAASGLDYYGARYYDPLAGQFSSGDSVVPGGGFDLWGLSRYAYVEGNPENRTDPSGHCYCDVPGTGDNFFPQSGGRLLDGDTGVVYSGPSYSQSYRLPSWSAHPHHYAPYQPYKKTSARAWPITRTTTHINVAPPETPRCCTTVLPGFGRIAVVIHLPWPGSFHCCTTTTPDRRSGTMFEDTGNQDDQPTDDGPVDETPGATDHGEQRQEEGQTDPHRQVGDPNRVIREGQRYVDEETGHIVYVSGNRVVIVDENTGERISQFVNPRSNTIGRIDSGRWVPSPAPSTGPQP